MSLLSELTAIAGELKLPVETGVFTDTAPNQYLVLTPIIDLLELHADNLPSGEVQEVRISFFVKGSYTILKNALTRALLRADLPITDRRYNGHENDTGYHQYTIDVAKYYELEE